MSQVQAPPPLSAKDPNSFAYPTMKDRIPVILSKIVDHLNRNKDSITKQFGGEPAREELKVLIGAMSQLRHEVMTNKPAAPLRDSRADAAAWNTELELEVEKQDGEPLKWFDSAWLWMECYLYRRIQEAPLMCNLLKSIDVFKDQKQAAFLNSYKAISTLTMYLLEATQSQEELTDTEQKKYFIEFLQMALWGNKCDLSISAGQDNYQVNCPREQLVQLKPKLLIDDTEAAYQILRKAIESRNGQAGRVDIILDNAGFELMTDLCFAEFLISAGLASKIHLHAKAMPWFVSDVTEDDLKWTMQQMSAINSLAISQLYQKWKKRLSDGTWILEVSDFWTMPNDYSQMKEKNQELYSHLSKSDLLFFKGDLNYRKLVGDLQWDFTTEFSDSLRGFHPTPLCAMRSLKSDVVVGLKPGQAKETESKDPKWMINGEWAVVSVCDKVV